MKRDRLSELRILRGVHAGARAPLAAGAQLLGSDPDCDFVLSDAGIAAQHLRLEVDDEGTVVLHWLDGDAPPTLLQPGMGVAVGPVTLTVDAIDAPWRDDLPLLAPARTAPAGAPPAQALPEDAAPQAPAADARAARPAPGAAAPSKPRGAAPASRALLAGIVLLMLGCLAAAWWILLPGASGPAASAARTATPQDQRAQIAAIARELRLDDRISIEAAAGGGLTVRARQVSDSEAEALAGALSRLSPRPGLRVSSESELRIAVTEAVDRRAAGLGTTLSVRPLGEGRFRLEGQVPSAADRDDLLAGLRAEFPQARAFENGLQTFADLASAMVDALRARGVGNVDGQWQDGLLTLRVRLAPADVPRWEQALLAAASRFPVPFKASMDLRPDSVAPAGPMPLPIRSVVSGDPAYLVLADGSKLMVEGKSAGWRLVAITQQNVVLEGPAARRVVIDR